MLGGNVPTGMPRICPDPRVAIVADKRGTSCTHGLRNGGPDGQFDMPENQQDIDALLAEVNALAEEAVADIVGNESIIGHETATAVAEHEPPPSPARTPSPSIPPPADRKANGEDLQRILHIQVPVIVQLARNTMPLSEITGLTTGAIVEFDKPSDSELELLINNKCIGLGQAVKVGENFGLRITRIGSLHDRITALGKK